MKAKIYKMSRSLDACVEVEKALYKYHIIPTKAIQ